MKQDLYEAVEYFMGTSLFESEYVTEEDTEDTDPTDTTDDVGDEDAVEEATEEAPEPEEETTEIERIYTDFINGNIKEFLSKIKKGKTFAEFVSWAIENGKTPEEVDRVAKIVKNS